MCGCLCLQWGWYALLLRCHHVCWDGSLATTPGGPTFGDRHPTTASGWTGRKWRHFGWRSEAQPTKKPRWDVVCTAGLEARGAAEGVGCCAAWGNGVVGVLELGDEGRGLPMAVPRGWMMIWDGRERDQLMGAAMGTARARGRGSTRAVIDLRLGERCDD